MEDFLLNYGVLAVFALALVEVDAAPVLGGVVAHLGYLAPLSAVLAAATGAFVSDCVWYWVGRLNASWIRSSWLYRRAGERAERLINRLGWRQLPLCRLFYGTRVVTMVLWGTNRRHFGRFALIDALSCTMWAALLTGIGYVLSGSAEAILGRIKRVELWLLLGLLFVVGSSLVLRRVVEGGEKSSR
ncbi:MAG: hypothetical protein C4334_14930 [Pyrinomonas sp.]|uniref:DedA family protein n=1 Tax=Pyrinomonas sp. TaxID=2080306 RepID=UPI003324F963